MKNTMNNKYIEEVKKHNARIGKRSNVAIRKYPNYSLIVFEVLNKFHADEIGYKSALETLKNANCTPEDIKFFIRNSLV